MKARCPERSPWPYLPLPASCGAAERFSSSPLSQPVASASSPGCRAPDPTTVYISTIVHTG